MIKIYSGVKPPQYKTPWPKFMYMFLFTANTVLTNVLSSDILINTIECKLFHNHEMYLYIQMHGHWSIKWNT